MKKWKTKNLIKFHNKIHAFFRFIFLQKIFTIFRSDNSPNENSNNEYEKSESSSAKPSGNNSETDDSFDREKSMSATDQDSGSGSGPSSSQGDSSPNSQSIQFLLNKLICLIETTESAFKSHCQRLTGNIIQKLF